MFYFRGVALLYINMEHKEVNGEMMKCFVFQIPFEQVMFSVANFFSSNVVLKEIFKVALN